MNLVFGQDAEVAAWVAGQIPHMHSFGACSAIGFRSDDGQIAGGIVFHNYLPDYGNIEVSFAVANPYSLNRHLLSALLRYPFTQLGVQRVTAITPSDERTSVWRFLTQFGFQKEGRVRRGLGTGDAIIWGLLASEWATSRFNVDRVAKKRRRRKRGTLSLESHALH